MKINTNISLRDRSRITLNNFRGLDTLSTAVDVSAIHATDMKNLISRDGVNHKRFGWKTQFRIRDDCQFLKIQGIFNFKIFEKEFLIVYAVNTEKKEKKFFLISDDGNSTDITNSGFSEDRKTFYDVDSNYCVIKDNLLDNECKFFINGNKVYFVGCGDFLVFSKWENERYEIRRVIGNEDVYVPVTTENISSEESSDKYTRITAEEKNILSPYVFNTLFGPKTLNSGEIATYLLGPGNYSVESICVNDNITLTRPEGYRLEENDPASLLESTDDVKITFMNEESLKNHLANNYTLIEMKDGKKLYIRHNANGSYDLMYGPNNGAGDDLLDTVGYDIEENTTVVNYKKIRANLSERVAIIKDIGAGVYHNIDCDCLIYGDYRAFFRRYERELILCPVNNKIGAYCSIVDDIANIKVKIKYGSDDSDELLKAKIGCKFGIDGGTDRLFLVDNTGNTLRWSKDNDFTYFGDKSWCTCGTSDTRITGMDRLNDTTLLVVKEYSLAEPSIYVIAGNLYRDKTEADTIDYTTVFTPHGYQVGIGAVGQVINFNGDCLMCAKDGIYAVSLGENMTVDSRYVLHRSRQISNSLEKFDLSKAKCISVNDKFYISVGGSEQECFVADNKYTSSFKGDAPNVLNYEWWRWTNLPISVWGFVGNELWFGTDDGQICSFSDNFYDETFSRLYNGLANYEFDNNEIIGFTLNPDIKVGIGDVLTPTCNFYGAITTDKFECVGEETRFYLPLADYDDKEEIYINDKWYSIEKQEQDLYFSIKPYSTTSTEITFYRNYKDKPLTVTDDKVIKLKDRDNNFPKWSAVESQYGLNPAQDEFKATLSHKEPVVSKWVSGAMDLGTRAYSKSLTYLVLTGEKDLANRLKYGLITRFTDRDYELLRANNDQNFTQIDLQTISLDSNFASAFTKRLNMRNVNFVSFYFLSDTAEDIALNSVQIEYKLCKRNIGVR